MRCTPQHLSLSIKKSPTVWAMSNLLAFPHTIPHPQHAHRCKSRCDAVRLRAATAAKGKETTTPGRFNMIATASRRWPSVMLLYVLLSLPRFCAAEADGTAVKDPALGRTEVSVTARFV